MANPTVKFIKFLRDCPRNHQAAPGEKLIYDFNVLIDGEHRAILSKNSAGRGYEVYDPYHQPINMPGAYWPRVGHTVPSQAMFARTVYELMEAGAMPTIAQINAARDQRAADEAAKAAADRAARELWVIQQAAPDLLAAGKELIAMIDAYDMADELDAGEDGKGPVAMMRAAIEKARME